MEERYMAPFPVGLTLELPLLWSSRRGLVAFEDAVSIDFDHLSA